MARSITISELALRVLLNNKEFAVLKIIDAAHRPLSGRDVAFLLSMSPTTASRVLQKLERATLITKTAAKHPRYFTKEQTDA